MSDLERVITALVHNVVTRFPQHLTAPFAIQDICDQFIPYRTHRNALGVETNEYYQLAITRLLAGEGGYILAPDEVKKALRTELGNTNPDASFFRRFSKSEVRLGEPALALKNQVAQAAGNAVPARPPARSSAATAPTEPSLPAISKKNPPQTRPAPSVRATQPATNKEWKMPPGQRTTTSADLGGKCRYCHGSLPAGRDLTYCPHCGQDLTVHHCPACSSELDVGWKFCVICGRSVEE
jgi:hypothetical protein